MGRPGPNFMALLTVSKESALTEAGNSVLMSHVLITGFTRQSSLTHFAQKFGACT